MTLANYDRVLVEHIGVGNVLYMRERGYADDCSPGDWKEWGWDVEEGPPLPHYLGDSYLCPDVAGLIVREEGAFKALGNDLVDGVPTLHFADEGRLGQAGRVDEHNGRLVQVVTETVERNQSSENGPVRESMWRWTITFSGVGEPNVIIAPTVPVE